MTERQQAGRPADKSEAATPQDAITAPGDNRMASAPQQIFLSTAATRPWDWRLAAGFALASIVGLALAAPYASDRWPVTPSFIAAYEAALLVNDLITAVLLIGQFRQVRSAGVLIVGCGYLFDAVIVATHALSFPGAFSATGLLGATTQTTAWLYIMWHGTFPIFICAYALVVRSRWNAPLAEHRIGTAIGIGVVCAVGVAAVCTLVTTAGVDFLPEIISDNDYKRLVTSGIAPGAWLISLVALALLWVRTRGRSVLDLWLMVVMVAWLLDILLSTLISTVRYDFGWYAGRMYGLLAASFVLGALLLEATLLYGRLARLLVEAKKKNIQLQAAVSELDAFSYSVSHDLRAPLRAIDGFSRILLKQYGPILAEEPREYLQLVRDNTVQMGHLVDDLLTFSRLGRQPLTKQHVVAGTIIERIVSELQRQAEGRSVIVSVGELPQVWGDPSLLKQVFINLIGNAFKYTRQRTDAEIEIGTCTIGGEQAFFVRDNGAGFDMQYADQLFKVFQRLHRVEDFEGTGVGLAIVQRIIQRHGGRIWAEAAVDKGATFYFTTEVPIHG